MAWSGTARMLPSALDPSVAERPPHVDNTGGPVDITLLKRDPLPGPQPGRRREDHEGALTFTQPGGDLGKLRPWLERPLLGAPPLRVIDTVLGRVDVDHPPLDSATQHLPKRLRRFEAMPGRDRHPPSRDLLRTQLSQTLIAELADRFRQEPTQLLYRLRLRVVLGQVLIDKRGECQRASGAVRPP
jgi:hypothetical protein